MIIDHFVAGIIPLRVVILELVIGSWIVFVQDNCKTLFWFGYAFDIRLFDCIWDCCWIIVFEIGFDWKLLLDCWYGRTSTKGLDIWLLVFREIFGKGL